MSGFVAYTKKLNLLLVFVVACSLLTFSSLLTGMLKYGGMTSIKPIGASSSPRNKEPTNLTNFRAPSPTSPKNSVFYIIGTSSSPHNYKEPTNLTNFRAPKLTSPKNSFFYIKNPKKRYNICDQLELHIETRDGRGIRKKRGGDHMWATLHSVPLSAGAPVDEFIDHGDGTYTARFRIRWTGILEPRVRFVFTSEHAELIRSIRERAPNRLAYDNSFTANGTSEVTPCHINKDILFFETERELSIGSTTETCDFSDPKAGTTWFCLKPKSLSCSDRSRHMGNVTRGEHYLSSVIRRSELRVIQRPQKLKTKGTFKSVSVFSDANVSTCTDLPPCSSGLPPKAQNTAAGFYFRDSWVSTLCRAVSFPTEKVLKCLSNKSLFFYGDSTIRQWFEYLMNNLRPTMVEEDLGGSGRANIGPRRGRDNVHNITLFFRHHEYPIRCRWSSIKNIRFTVNEIDALPGGRDTVVAFSIWAHFTPHNLTYYRSRLEHVKRAISRLQGRGRGVSPVFFKSANTRNSKNMDSSDLLAYDLDQEMRDVFVDFPGVTVIDVWDMTVCHGSGYNIHPVAAVIREEIKMFLNFLCID